MTFKQRALATSMLSAALMATGGAAIAQVDTITVTATKTEATAQSIPVAVSALDAESLDELRVDNFEDYLLQLPGVTAGGGGPGQNTIYIRGVASTTPNLTTAGVAGLAPNVAFYLDEQPLAQPGRNLDVYAADMERVEVLPGPQGTLFGASSQAGTVRLITNKPVLGQYEASADFGVAFTEGGEPSNQVEAMINLPIGDNFALRGVVYVDNQGGYIDNVAGTRDQRESARFRDAGVVRANGVPVSDRRAGVQSPTGIANALAAGDTLVGSRVADFTGVTFIEANNADLVEDDFNEATYSGFRLAGRYEFNADWRLDVAVANQSLDSEGVFFQDPELGDWEIQRFEEDELEDTFTNLAYTLEGRLAALDIVYTGAFTNRETDQTVDYTDYMFVGQYFSYYTCDSSVSYPEYNAVAGVPTGTCFTPEAYVASTSELDVFSQELRFTTPQDRRIRATGGVFYSDTELKERNDFRYLGSTQATIFGGSPGFADNFAYTDGYRSGDGPFPEATIFRNDVLRTDTQFGVFGEAAFDFTDQFTVIVGARYYDIEVDLEGAANASFCNGFQPDVNSFGADISDLYDGDGQYTFRNDCAPATEITFDTSDTFQSIKDALEAVDPFSIGRGQFASAPNAISDSEIQRILDAINAPEVAASDGVIAKVTAEWTPSEDLLFYATYSEGFRPGLLNRPATREPFGGGFSVPFTIDTDETTNYELGFKTLLFNSDLQFNGNLFFVQIEGLQTTIFDPSISNLFFSANAADAEVIGFEGDLTWQPADIPGLTVAGAYSILDTEITDVLIPTDDVVEGEELAFAPELQVNGRIRYEWPAGQYTAHVQTQATYTADQRTDIIEINSITLDGYATLAASAGLAKDNWQLTVFANNLTNENGSVSGNFIFDRERVTVLRPRTVGARFTLSF